MPTAARLFAAIAFAAVAFFASESFVFELPEGTNVGWFSQVNAALGALAGWTVMGPLAGHGYRRAIGAGFRTTAVMVFYMLILHCLYEMIRLSMKLRYNGPGDAVSGFFELLLHFGLLLVTSVPTMAILVVGGVLAAWLTEWAGERWS